MRETKEAQRGITLIALVITVIILLILAGISIAMLTGDNGLLTKADKATEEHSHASVREGIILAYNEYQTELKTLAKETRGKENVKLASTEVTKVAELNITKDTSFIEFLQGKDYIDANGIVNTQELLGSKTKLGNGNKTEYKDVYSVALDEENNRYVLTYHYTKDEKKELWKAKANGNAVKINVSKTPETEMAPYVDLKVTSIEGIVGVYADTKEEALEQLRAMEEAELKELLRQTEIAAYNKWEEQEFTDFKQVLEYMASGDSPILEEATEDAFWAWAVDFEGSLEEKAFWNIQDLYLNYNDKIRMFTTYEIINHDGIPSDSYRAYKNGTYIFTVKDLLTNKTYTKSINVDNIDESARYVIYHVPGLVELMDRETGKLTTFNEGYVLYQGEELGLSSKIKFDEATNANYITR